MRKKDEDENDDIFREEESLYPVVLPYQEMITGESSLKEIIEEDVEHMNNALRGVYQGWAKANTVGKICQLAITQSLIVTQRRKLLLKPSSYRDIKEIVTIDPKKKIFEYEPL